MLIGINMIAYIGHLFPSRSDNHRRHVPASVKQVTVNSIKPDIGYCEMIT